MEEPFLYRPVFLFLFFSRIMQPFVLTTYDPIRQLLLWRWFDEYALTWVFGSSFFYLRQQHQQHTSVAGMFLFDSSADPLFTDAMRGQSIRVHASSTPLRIPLAGRIVVHYASVDAVAFFSGLKTVMYPGLLLKTFL